MQRTMQRLRSEFLEMPGLRLTRWQVQRLCGIDETICQGVLDALVDTKFLRGNPDGTYVLMQDNERTRPRQARVDTPIRREVPKAS